jgi:hypothetical protein
MYRRRYSAYFFPALITCCILLISYEPLFATIFEVGPGKKHQKISQVPFDTLMPGDSVKIYYRDEPYRETIVIMRSGTKENPIVIAGIPENGKRPVIDGSYAYQAKRQVPGHFGRSLITVGDETPGDYVVIKNFVLRNANNSQPYYLNDTLYNYKDNAAGVFLWRGRHVTVSDCLISSCGDGILTNVAPEVEHFTLNHCTIFDNGNHRNIGSSQEHNVYLQGEKTIVQFCRFGEPHSDGNNIKDRGLDTIIRFNWIEGGMNRQLDLVDYKEYKKAHAYVYGNVIIQGQTIHNYNMIHWGGESGSRSGTLFFFNNTVIGKSNNTRFLFTRFSDCNLQLINNVFDGAGLLWNEKGGFEASNNWISSAIGVPMGINVGLRGYNPLFITAYGIPYLPGSNSPLVDSGSNTVQSKVNFMPQPKGGGLRRPRLGRIDIGAFESGTFWFDRLSAK